jgi:hypothetical protein
MIVVCNVAQVRGQSAAEGTVADVCAHGERVLGREDQGEENMTENKQRKMQRMRRSPYVLLAIWPRLRKFRTPWR